MNLLRGIVELRIMRSFLFNIWEVLEVVLIAAVTVFLIRAFIVQPFLVSGRSMFSSFVDADYVLVDELSYIFKGPERGDVIVFRYPLNPKLFYIKRVIGTPGDHVVVKDGEVFVNEVKLKEEYLDPGVTSMGRVDEYVGEGELMAFGDNRPHSYDSRSFGPFPFDNIIGVVRVRLLPIVRAQVINRPSY